MIILPWSWLALPLLFVPLGLFLSGRVKLAPFDRRAWPGARSIVLLALDPLRAGAAAWLIMAEASVGGWSDWKGLEGFAGELTVAAILGLGLAVQTLGRPNTDYVLAPVGFMAGLMAVYFTPLVAGLALVAAIGSAWAFRAWPAVFVVGGLAAGAIGFGLMEESRVGAVMFGVWCASPALLAMLMGKQMALPRSG